MYHWVRKLSRRIFLLNKKTARVRDRMRVAKQNAESVKNLLKGKGVTFLGELVGKTTVLQNVPKKYLALGYLLYEADVSISQISTDFGISLDSGREVKRAFLNHMKSLISSD